MRLLSPFLLSVCLLPAQVPVIGTIDFYGVRKTPEDRVRKALGLKPGDSLPRNKSDLEEALEQIPGIVAARLEATCCEDGQAILYVGLEERGSPRFEYHPAPQGEELVLPDTVILAYAEFLKAVASAGQIGEVGEDLSRGYSLMANPEAQARQTRFLELAVQNAPVLRDVLRRSQNAEQRAMAAYLLPYAAPKVPRREVIADLQFAMQDPDDTVRANAMRGLGALSIYAKANPKERLRVEPTWFVEMLNSLVWTDRNNAAVALVNLTESRDAKVLEQIRERALPSIVEMARWKHLPHALPAYILAGRTAGLPEPEIQARWSKGDRDSILKALQAKPAAKP